MAYGLASLVDYSRIRGPPAFPLRRSRRHVMGNLIAQNVYSRHHDPGLAVVNGDRSANLSRLWKLFSENQVRRMSPWIAGFYPALDRLAALGSIDSGFAACGPGRGASAHVCWRGGGEDEGKAREEPKPRRSIVCWKRIRERSKADGAGKFGDDSNRLCTRHRNFRQATTDGYHFARPSPTITAGVPEGSTPLTLLRLDVIRSLGRVRAR